MTARHVVRGRLLSFENGPDRPWYVEDGFLLIEDGVIAARGDLVDMPAADVPVTRYDGDLVMAGLIDTHIHYPQTQVIASYGAQLLDWLQRYTFVEEQRFADPAHAAAVAGFFLEELFRNGTTTAAVYCTVHANSVDAFFEASSARNSRMIAGKVMMDRGAPDGLLDTAERGHRESAAAIARWHGRGRQRYAVTPRFAPTSSEPQLEAAGDLLRAYPDCYLQTHLSENRDEIRAVAGLFPWSANYTQVYERFGLLGPRSIFEIGRAHV